MKTTMDVIRELEEQEETGVGMEVLTGWLREVEAELERLRKERYGMEPEEREEGELTVPAPWDSMYTHYLKAMTAYRNGETARYNNAMAMYQQVMSGYRAWLIRQNMPVQVKATYF